MKKIFWKEEDIEYVKEHYPFSPTEAIALHLNCSLYRVYNLAFRLKLKKDAGYLNSPLSGRMMAKDTRGLPTRFPTGHKPWNRGKKGIHIGGEETQFKAGHLPHNHKPVGSVRKQVDGYWYIKVEEPKKWVALHQKNWIEVNGHIPEGKFLKFKDGNLDNCDASNLYLSDRANNMKDNTIHRYPPELKSAIKALSKLKKQIHGTE